MSFPNHTGYLDPTGRATSPVPAAPVSPPPTASYQRVGPQTYAPITLPTLHRKRRRLSPLSTALLAVLVGLVLAVPVVALAAQRQGVAIVPTTPSAADAKTACKSAIELEAQGRVEKANESGGDSAVGSITGIEIDEPVRTGVGYSVNGAIKYQILSFIGTLPGTVYVTCDATISGSKLTTSVRNR